MNSIFHRTSIRAYTDQPVEDTKITKLLQAAMAAPSAGNQQPWEFYVVKDSTMKAQLSACSPYAGCAANAPVVIVPCYRKEAIFPENVSMDLSAATENILLAADAQDLGAVWLGIAPLEDRMSKVRKVLNLPTGLEAFALIPVGYPVKVGPQQDRYDESRVHYMD
ncbi:MAG: nitroreductase family protein [Clostridiales bacterium]|nr:nitroreductase family protein [Clostridiales bacterium]